MERVSGVLIADTPEGPVEVRVKDLPRQQLILLARAGDREAALLLLRRRGRRRG